MIPVAVCFDYRGTLIDHRTGRAFPEMVALLQRLEQKGLQLALVSRFPAALLEERLGDLKVYFGKYVFSSSESDKLSCILQFAADLGIEDLSRICFVDDKPANLLLVARKSTIRAIGFAGSGKYPETAGVCKEAGIPVADSPARLEQLILAE
jgi:FMN phosphatase YigB (HAD superfamily)